MSNCPRLVHILCVMVSAGLCLTPTIAMADVEGAKFSASDGATAEWFGQAVSISGNQALVGAPNDDDNGLYSGSAYVFRFDGNEWVEVAKLTASDGAAVDFFGHSVSISGDVALIGAHGDDDDGSFSGSAYVFRFDGSAWVEEAKLTAAEAEMDDQFGYSVSISGDRALIGAQYDKNDDLDTGSAYVFFFNGSSWAQEQRLLAADTTYGDFFGASVSISGNAALIGATGDDDNAPVSGSAYIFRFNGSNWLEEGKITASDAAIGDRFGSSVSISGDAALVGAYDKSDAGSKSGAAYVYGLDNGTWLEEAKLTAPNAVADEYFGYSVSISAGIALVGAWEYDALVPRPGSAYAFGFDGNSWIQEEKLTASDADGGDRFGFAVAVSDGTILVGAYGDYDNGPASGSVYVFGDLVPPAQLPSLSPLGMAILWSSLGVAGLRRLRS